MSASDQPEALLDGSSGGLLHQYGRRISRDTMIYGWGNTTMLLLSLATLVVFTHYMKPSEYGELSILFFFAGAFTILLNLVPLAGILRWVWVAGDADVGAVDDPSRQAPGGTKRRALGTGVWLSLLFIAVGCGALIPFAAPLAKLLLGSHGARDDVLLAIASGAAGALFRLATNVVRMERRPVAFSALLSLRPLVMLAIAVPLIANGAGVAGGLYGTIGGSLLPTAVAVFVARHNYSLRFSWTDVRGIMDLGLKYTFVITGLWTVHNGDAFVMSRFASHASVGVYRVAARLGAVLSYLVASFLQAWSPLERGALFQSTYDQHGLTRVHSKMITYFFLSGLTVMLAVSLGGGVLIQLSPHAYHHAEALVPFTSFFFVIYGIFVLIARTTYYSHRDFVHQFGAAAAAVVYFGMAALLVPRWGGYGLAIAATIGMIFGCACFRAISRWATRYALLDWPRFLSSTAIVAGCVAIGQLHAVGHGLPRVLVDLGDFFILWPAALVLLGIVPRRELRLMRDVALETIGSFVAPLRRRHRAVGAARALAALRPDDVEVLRALISQRVPPATVATRRGVARSVLEGQAARSLRTLMGVQAPERDDAAIGYWLFEVQSSAERDVIMYNMTNHGVSVSTLHAVEAALGMLKAIPADMWPVGSAEEAPSQERVLVAEPSTSIG